MLSYQIINLEDICIGGTWDFMKAVPLPLKLGLRSRINEGEKGEGGGTGSSS